MPTNIISHGDGTYIVDLPPDVPSNSYVVQVEDTRGLSVLASSFSQFTTSLAWNTTGFKTDPDYVDSANLDVLGTHSNFAAQQSGPDSIYDTLTEAANGTTLCARLPNKLQHLWFNNIGKWAQQTACKLTMAVYMSFHSYASSFSGSDKLLENY